MTPVPVPKMPPPGWTPRGGNVAPVNEPSIRAAVRSDVEIVSQEAARRWLAETNTLNRSIRSRKVDEYRSQMLAGEFLATGEPIIFDWNGVLVSGQHRLLAFTESGLPPMAFVVVRGVDPAVRDVVDTGIKRTLGDTFRLHGIQDSNNVAAAVGWYWRYTEGKMRWPNIRPSNITSLALIDEHPGLIPATKIGQRIRRATGGPCGLYGALFYVFDGIDHETAVEFTEQIVQGTLLQSGDPAFAFRRLWANVSKSRKPETVYVAALFIKAWNACRAGKQVQTLIWRPASGESFPEAR